MNQSSNQDNNMNSKLNFSNYENIPTREEYLRNMQMNQNMVNNSEMERPKTINEQITNTYNNIQNNQMGLEQNNVGVSNIDNQNQMNFNNQNMGYGNQNIGNQQMTNQSLGNNNGINNQISNGFNNINYDIDEEFSVPKKKPFGIILLIILILVFVGGIVYYFLVLDNPKTIFSSAINNLSKSIVSVNTDSQEKLEKINLEYDIDVNFLTTDEDSQLIYNIFNDITLNMKLGMDKNEEKVSLILNPMYKDKEVIDIHMLAEAKDNGKTYLKLDGLYDKVIYVEDTEDENEKDDKTDNQDVDIPNVSLSDYKLLVSSVINNFKDTLDGANYEKEYVKLNGEYVKKVSLILDNEFMSTLYMKLINDSDFVSSYAKISKISEEEVVDELNYEISELDEDTYELYSLYLSIIGNEFIMFEDDAGEDGLLKITKDNNKYSFEYEEDYTLLYQGYFEYKDNSDKDNLLVSLDFVEDELSVELDIDMKTDKDMGIDELDTKDAVNIDNMSNDDMNKIMEKFLDNEAVKLFLSDTGLDYYLSMEEPQI